MARSACSLLRALLATLVLAVPAVADEPALDRAWAPGQQLDPEAGIVDARVAPFGIGESVALYSTSAAQQRTQVSRLGVLEPPSVFPGEGFWNMFEIEGSPLHGAVGAWTSNEEAQVAEIAPAGERLEVTRVLSAARADYSYGRPVVQVGAAGQAVVAYLGQLPLDAGVRVMAVVREADGSWSDPLPVTPAGLTNSRFARSAAVGLDGTVVLGVAMNGRARVAVREPGGAFTLSEPLGEPLPEYPWNVPRVGVDAAGTVVAAWLEGAETNEVGDVKVAFRAPGAATFGDPQGTGMAATDTGQIEMGVSAPGEVVLAVEASSDNPYGGTRVEGLQVAYGFTHLQRLGEPARISYGWGSYPSFDMNARGDAIAIWDECCPMRLIARRRAPLGPFGPYVDVEGPIEFEGSRSGRFALDADLDDLGNARAAWVDGEQPRRYMIGTDGPLLETALPEVGELGDVIPPVLGPQPEVPWQGVPEPMQSQGEPELPAPAPPLIPVAASPPMAPPEDLRAPVLSIVADRAGRRRVLARLACDEACGVRLRAVAGRRGGRWVDAMLRDGRSLRIGIPLPRRVRGKLRLEGVVADPLGNLGRFRRGVHRR